MRRTTDRQDPPPVDPGFVEFVAARSAALFRTAVLITGDRHAAEDLVQSALERAFRNWDRVAAADAPEAYVRRIMANLATDQGRTRGRAAAELRAQDAPARAVAPAPDPAARVAEREAVISALREVPVRMRTVLVLRYFDDLSEAQAADVLGISIGTVKSQAARGLAKLRAVMAVDEAAAEAVEPTGAGAPPAHRPEPADPLDSAAAETAAATVIPFPQGGSAA